jgi:nucleotide-binding universal stress UspA family protein
MFPLQKILHPTDFSPCSAAAFELACALARVSGASLTLVHVQRPVEITGKWALPPPVPVPLRETLQEQLSQLRPPDPTLNVERYLKEGDPAAEILRLAQEGPYDLIVLGTHGWTGLNRLLMGSVAEEVLRRAPCPVLTVKVPPPQAHSAPDTRREPAAV